MLKAVTRWSLGVQWVLKHKSSRSVSSSHRRWRTRQVMGRQLIVRERGLLEHCYHGEMRSNPQASDRSGAFRLFDSFIEWSTESSSRFQK